MNHTRTHYDYSMEGLEKQASQTTWSLKQWEEAFEKMSDSDLRTWGYFLNLPADRREKVSQMVLALL